jgi:hypothetical protein
MGCSSGETKCQGQCVKQTTDVNNCGRCGKKCESGQKCVQGQCSGGMSNGGGGGGSKPPQPKSDPAPSPPPMPKPQPQAPPKASDDKCTARQGKCQNTATACSGTYVSNLCPGASNIKCCTPKSGSGGGGGGSNAPSTPNSSQCSARKGQCQSTASPCSGGVYLSGLCSGSSSIKCCAPIPKVPDPPASTKSLSDSAAMDRVQGQQNSKLSVGTYTGVNGFFQSKNGALVYSGKMATDCDGAPTCPQIDPHGQTSTSWSYGGKPIDALKVNYIVLPSDLSKKVGSKYKLGDIAAISYKGKVSYGVYADNGPLGKAGEGSVHLVVELGHNPYCGTKICTGISSGVSYVLFPDSRQYYDSPYDDATIRSIGAKLLRNAIN